MLATQPPEARALAGKHKKKKAVKNKAISKKESVKPYVQDCLNHVTRVAIERCKHITACLDHVTRIAIERWKDITLELLQILSSLRQCETLWSLALGPQSGMNSIRNKPVTYQWCAPPVMRIVQRSGFGPPS